VTAAASPTGRRARQKGQGPGKFDAPAAVKSGPPGGLY
jgi:hypothetical protein